MTDGSQNNAMTEIALALAMGFFSIMVLTMVSMGVEAKGDPKAVDTALLAPATSPNAAPVGDDDRLLIFHDGRFYDRDLNPADPAASTDGKRVVLALDPDLPMAKAMAARARVPTADLVITALDGRWKEALHDRR